ncbi:MAG: P-loop NTPase fold protein [Cyanobacteriota bacterium]
MAVDLRKFFQATDPGKALAVDNPEDKKYYIDFSSVRGGEIIKKLKQKITFFSPDAPTCVLFTGHIGCGKSTELLRLRTELEHEGFHVVYFESSEDLEMTDVDISDVLLAIARRVSQSLDKITLEEPSRLKGLLQGAWKVLNSEVTGFKLKPPEMPGVPKLGDIGITSENDKFSLAFGIGEITTRAKSDATLREKLNQYLGPQKTQLLEAINQELLEPAIASLKQQGKKGLVVIVDNLDRLDSRQKPFGRPQQEYLFVDQGEYLTKLNCHLVYTMPLALKFSNDYGNLTQRFEEPRVLPMVPVQLRDGSECDAGMELLRQMILARAFPNIDEQQRLNHITKIFDSPKTLDRLCRVSGGHVRDLLRLLNTWIMEEMELPLSGATLEAVIRARRNEMTMPISDDEWELLRQVRQRKKVSGDQGYQTLIRSRLVFEYRDSGESWFDINPILAEAKELQP